MLKQSTRLKLPGFKSCKDQVVWKIKILPIVIFFFEVFIDDDKLEVDYQTIKNEEMFEHEQF